MKLNIRLISLLLSLIMILGIFASCDSDPADTTEADQTSDTAGNGDVTEAPSAGERTAFELIVNGEATVKVIRPEALNSNSPAVTAAVKIRNKLEDTTGVKLTMGDDFKKATESYDETTIEILVGNTKYPQTAEAIKDLKYGDFTVKAVGNKIIVFGFTADAIDHAANQFIKIVKEYYDKDAAVANLTIPTEALDVTGTHAGSKQLSILPVIDGSSFYSTYASNIDCEEIILDDVTADSYNAYITKLEGEGYTKYTSNDINGNLFTTLYNNDYTLNVGYYKPYDQCRIIMEPYSAETLPGLESENQYKVVTTSQVTMIGCEYKKSDGYAGNGLCLLFRLADGRFVIVDGSFNRADNAATLVNIIKEQAKEYATGKDIKIAAWFVSHAHSDHDGVLKGQYTSFRQFTVERVIANFMTDEERQRSINSYSDNWSSTEGGSDDDDRAAAAALGADFIVCHVGQRFYFADTVFEILYTVESYGPTIVNALNTSTILVRAITTDASGKSSTTMIMGDCTGPAMAICNKMYGTNLRAEIVQVAHHGYTTWGNDTAMATAYKYMAPEIVLWPQGNNAFPNYKEKSYNKVLWDGTNKNFQQMYVAGWIGSQYIVPLPYSGSADSVISLPKSGN